jgi:DNA-binding transcriptional LysR family regulator
MNIELRHLRYFVAVAEDLHFAKAAKRLSISQPPLSQQILALEREIGARLFERSNRRVELTDAGRVFLKEATEILGKVDNAAVVAERIHKGQLGELRVVFLAPHHVSTSSKSWSLNSESNIPTCTSCFRR